MSVAALTMQDLKIYPDLRWARTQSIAAIDFDPAAEAKQKALVSLIGAFAREKLIEPETARGAIAFISLLPLDRAFPKITADGEGALLLYWDHGSEPVLLTVDRRELHTVIAAATPASKHLPPTVIRGGKMPNSILGAIPAR